MYINRCILYKAVRLRYEHVGTLDFRSTFLIAPDIPGTYQDSTISFKREIPAIVPVSYRYTHSLATAASPRPW
jgi:hypothetical protein